MSFTYEKIMVIKGCKNLLNFPKKYEISKDTTLELRGEFRSSGNKKSIIYFGLQSFKENGAQILAPEVYRLKEYLTVISLGSDGKSFNLNKKPETWNNKTEEKDERDNKYIGIYFDGNISRCPDYLIKSPAYKIYENNIINLNQ